jgi:hypothetical protein
MNLKHKTMKTTIRNLIMLFFIIGVTLTSFSQNKSTAGNGEANSRESKSTCKGSFADKNNNGICDNFESRQVNAKGKNFVDENGDGICDKRGTIRGNGNSTGTCTHHGRLGNGNGCNRGYGLRHHGGDNVSPTAR